MAIDSSAPAPTTDRFCSSSASDTSSGGGEPRPTEKTSGSEAVCLKKLLQNTPPEYLTLSLPPRSAPAAAAYRRRKRPEEASLAGVDASRDYLSLSLITPSENPKRRRGPDYVSGGGGSVVTADASPVASTEGALVLVESVIRPPPPPAHIPEACLPPKSRPGRGVSAGGGSVVVADASTVALAEGALVLVESMIRPPPPPLRIPEACLPPKKRKLVAAGFALATVNHHDGVSGSRSSWPTCDGGRHYPATVASHPIDAVPLQAVYVHDGVSRPFRLGSSAGEITMNKTAAAPPVAGRQAKQ